MKFWGGPKDESRRGRRQCSWILPYSTGEGYLNCQKWKDHDGPHCCPSEIDNCSCAKQSQWTPGPSIVVPPPVVYTGEPRLTDQEIGFIQELLEARYGPGWSGATVHVRGFTGIEPDLRIIELQRKLQDMMNSPERVRSRERWNAARRRTTKG